MLRQFPVIGWQFVALTLLTLGMLTPAGAYDTTAVDQNEVIASDPTDAGAFYDRGLAFAHKGKLQRAIDNFNKAIRLNPDYADAYYDRGLAYASIGDNDRAIADLGKAIEFNPAHAFPYANRGYAYFQKGNYGLAIADFDKAIELGPDLADVYYNRGLAYDARGHTGRAIADFDKVIELDPDHVSTYRSRGRAHFNRGDFEAAVPDLRRDAEGGSVYGMLWLFVAQSNALQMAATELATNAASLKSKAWPYPIVELYLGQQPAAAIFAKAGNANQRCEAYFYIGEWHLVHGRPSQAIEPLRTAVRICPRDFMEYSGALAELGRIE